MKKRVLAFIMTFLMVIMLLPSLAFANDEKSAGGGTATLTIINGVDDWGGGPVVLVNEKFQFEEGDTLGDLFKAAKDGGVLDDFEFKGQYIYSITDAGGSAVANASDWSYYWSTYKNGEYVQGPTDGTESDLLTDGVCFQFAVEAYPPNKEPSADEWAELQEDTSPIESVAGEGEAAGSATVMIIKGYGSAGPIALINDEIEFAEGATLEDAFDALVEEEELNDYSATEYGYLSSITYFGYTYTQPADYSSYWACYKNEGYASGTDCTMGDALTDGTRFEFVWLDYPSKVGLSSEAWAELSAKAEVHKKKATLTIIEGVDSWTGKPLVMVNKQYVFEKGATLEDLFQAAVDAGDLGAFEFGTNGYIESITSAGGHTLANVRPDLSYYWGNYKNGEFAWDDISCQNIDLLEDGVCYQFAYQAYPPNAEPTAEQWEALLEDSYLIDSIAGTGDKVGTATFIIIKGQRGNGSPMELINDEIEFAAGATVEDAFDALVEEDELEDYAFSESGFLSSVTWLGQEYTQPADFSSYWGCYKNETYASGSDCSKDDVLTDGTHYEFVWLDYPARVGLENAEWDALSALAEAGSGAAHGPIYPSPADGTAEVEKEAAFNKDFSELYENFIGMGMGSSGWMAMGSIAAGMTDAGDLNVVLAQAEADYNAPSGSNLQKSIIILTAMGVDVTAVEFEEGSPVNLLEKLAKNPIAVGAWAESPAYSLIAFGANPDYGVDRSYANNPDKLIENLAGYQVPDGTFGWNGQTGSPDSTGAALAAFACYMDNEQAAEMIAAALEGLKAYQNEDGGFGWEAGADTSVDSTAQVIIGLCALGIDPTGAEWTKGENNPVTALMTFANADNTDIKDMPGMDVDYARDDMFRAMAAFAGLRNTGAAYNVYTRAIEGNAKFDYEVKYELSDHQLDIPVGSTAKLEYKGNDGSVAEGAIWISSDPAIVEVLEDGTVNALMIGKAKITVTTADEKQSDSCDINVLFKDVTDKSLFYYDYIYALVDAGIIAGYNDGTFRPMNECNRAAVVTFLWRSAGKPEPANMASFSDLTGNEEFDKAISWAVEQGITNGWTDNTFRPWRTCNRAAVLTFLWRMAKEPEPTKMAEFSDMTGNEEFDKAISWAVEQGIATGWPDNTVRPWNTCNRLAIASFIARYLEKQD